MGKRYLDTKEGSLESSVLGVWQTAIEEGEARMDGRTKQYKSHRANLETARQRREEKKKLNREEIELDEDELDEISIEEIDLFELDDEMFEAAMKKKSAGDRKAAKKKRDKWLKTPAGKKSQVKAKKRAAKVRKGSIKVDKAKSKAAKKRAKLYAGDDMEVELDEVELDEGSWRIGDSKKTGNFKAKSVEDAIEMAKKKGIKVDQMFSVYDRDKRDWIYDAAMGKPYREEVEIDEGTWKIPKGVQLQGLKKLLTKPLELGKNGENAMDALDNFIGDDELFDDLGDAGEKDPKGDARPYIKDAMKRLGINEEVELDEASGDKEAYKKFFDAALKKFKVSSPAEFKSDEEKKKFFDYIDKNWEGDNEKAEDAMSQVREFKIQSMKAALAQVWGMEEGHNPFAEHKGTKPHKHPHEEEEVVKKGKTETGKKPAAIDLKPKIDD